MGGEGYSPDEKNRCPIPGIEPAKALVAGGIRHDPGRSSGSFRQARPSGYFPVAREGTDFRGTDGGGTALDSHGIPIKPKWAPESIQAVARGRVQTNRGAPVGHRMPRWSRGL